jgi:Ca2+/Na+ antiporter
MEDPCSYLAINSSLDMCAHVKQNCEYAYVNLYSLHYCTFDTKLYFTLPIMILFALLCFYLLSDTANRYLSSSLTAISDKLGLSQNLAGITLLAFGNGAPDVISSIVASDGEDEGLELSIGALLGGGLVVTSFVFAAVVLFAKKVKLNKSFFTRDILIYLLALAVLILFAFVKIVTLWMSILYLSIYVVFVIVAIFQDRSNNRRNSEKKEKEIKLNDLNIEGKESKAETPHTGTTYTINEDGSVRTADMDMLNRPREETIVSESEKLAMRIVETIAEENDDDAKSDISSENCSNVNVSVDESTNVEYNNENYIGNGNSNGYSNDKGNGKGNGNGNGIITSVNPCEINVNQDGKSSNATSQTGNSNM